MMKKIYICILLIVLTIIYIGNNNCVIANNEKEIGISYQTHVQNIGWQDWKKNGEMSGTEGLSYRLEGARIKLINAPRNAKIAYKVHVQNVGWQDWKSDGNFAGTEGMSLRLEGIQIKLENIEDYSVMYRVHVQNIGWQDWRYDGEFAGTEGQSLRLEGIEIKIVPKTKRGIVRIESPKNNEEINNKQIKVTGWSMSNVENDKIKLKIDDGEEIESNVVRKYRWDVLGITGGYGSDRYNPNAGYEANVDLKNIEDGIHKITVNLYTKENELIASNTVNIKLDTTMKVLYQTHVQNIGWQDWKKNGEMSGTEGLSYRLEGARIKLINAPEKAKISYKVHVQNVGWQDWKSDGNFAGTEGMSLRLEGIQIKLENIEDYSVMYRVHVQNIGWQDWRYDGEFAGTEGQSLRLEGIEIKIVPKTKRGIVRIESPKNNEETNNKQIKVTGWSMSNVDKDKIKVRIDDGEEIEKNIERKYRGDVLGITGGYGSDRYNPNAGYEANIDLTNIKDGIHKITVNLYTEENELIASNSVNIRLDTTMKVLYQTHVQNIGWQNWQKDGSVAGTEGMSYRIEAIRIKLINAPENYKIQYKVHIQNIGWQGWKEQDQVAGTEGMGYRVEAIEIRLVDKYTNKEIENTTIQYQAHIQNIGWQREKIDGETAGTVGDSYRIEALKINLINTKLPRGKINLESPERTVFTGDTISIKGWEMSTTSDSLIEVYMDNIKNNDSIVRESRADVINTITNYGNYQTNPTPSFTTTINLNNYSEGNHTLIIKLYSKNKTRLLDEIYKPITIAKNIYFGVDVSAWQESINWDRTKQEGINYAIIRIGYGQTLTNKDKFFEANYSSCERNNIPIGIYTYSYAENVEEARQEAYSVLNWLDGRSLRLPIFWDTEANCQKNIDKNTLTQMADEFCSIIQSHTDINGKRYKAGIYASTSWLNNKLNMSYLETKYDVWVAQYYYKCTYNGRYEIWQHSSEGNISGIKGNVDCNWFYKKY